MTPLYNVDVFDHITDEQYRKLYLTDKDVERVKSDRRFAVLSVEKFALTLEEYREELDAFYPNGVVDG